MAIKICENGHITGFRHCATCGTDKVTQQTWRDRKISLEWAALGTPEPVKAGIPARQQIYRIFRQWREKHRAKVAARKAA